MDSGFGVLSTRDLTQNQSKQLKFFKNKGVWIKQNATFSVWK